MQLKRSVVQAGDASLNFAKSSLRTPRCTPRFFGAQTVEKQEQIRASVHGRRSTVGEGAGRQSQLHGAAESGRASVDTWNRASSYSVDPATGLSSAPSADALERAEPEPSSCRAEELSLVMTGHRKQSTTATSSNRKSSVHGDDRPSSRRKSSQRKSGFTKKEIKAMRAAVHGNRK